MDLLTGAVLLGLGYFGVKALSGGSGAAAAPEKGKGLTPDCGDPKDCTTLVKCAQPVLASATVADIAQLNKMLVKASALGCADLVDQIGKVLDKFAKDAGGGASGGSDAKPGSYTVMNGVGVVAPDGAKPGDMLIIALVDSTGTKKYVTPVSFTSAGSSGDGYATFEKTLAALAVDKFQKTSPIGDPTALLGAGSVVLGAPADLPDGTSFHVKFGNIFSPGQVIGVVTAAQMKGGLTVAPTPSSFAEATAGDGVYGEEAYQEQEEQPGRVFGGKGFGGGGLGSGFGSSSSFGGRVSIGG